MEETIRKEGKEGRKAESVRPRIVDRGEREKGDKLKMEESKGRVRESHRRIKESYERMKENEKQKRRERNE